MNAWGKGFCIGVICSAGVMASVLLYRSETPRQVSMSGVSAEALTDEMHAIRDQLVVLAQMKGTEPRDTELPARDPVAADPVDRGTLDDISLTLKQQAVDLQDVKQQLAAIQTLLGVASKQLEEAGSREPDRIVTQQISNEIAAGPTQYHDVYTRWALRSIHDVVTKLGRPNLIARSDGRITALHYSVDRGRIEFQIGNGVVVGLVRLVKD